VHQRSNTSDQGTFSLTMGFGLDICAVHRHVAIGLRTEHAQGMKFIRGAISAILLAGAFAAALRVRGTGGTPPEHGGWRPLELPED
jgi:hypothetical protein